MAQQWCDLLFAHWPIPADTMRQLVPQSLELDLWEGEAWVGVVPFRMQGVRPRYITSLPWISAFAELNVRTYVTMRDNDIEKPGVYFFSLEAANPVAVAIARNLFKLPYFNAEMVVKAIDGPAVKEDNRWGSAIDYCSHRTHRGAPTADFVGTYGPTGAVYRSAPGSFDSWLTARYALYTTDAADRVYIGEIHHDQWPLQPATATFTANTVAAASGLSLPDREPILQFARHLDVVVWPLRRLQPAIPDPTRT